VKTLFCLKTITCLKCDYFNNICVDLFNHICYYTPIATNNTGSKKMTLAEALAKIEQHKEQLKPPKQDYQPQPKQTRKQARAQYNFMRGMP